MVAGYRCWGGTLGALVMAWAAVAGTPPQVATSAPAAEAPAGLAAEPPAGTRIVHPVDGAIMVYVPSGYFWMGMDLDAAQEHAESENRRLIALRISSSVSRWATKTSVRSPFRLQRGACSVSQPIRGSVRAARLAASISFFSEESSSASSADPDASARRILRAARRAATGPSAGRARTFDSSASRLPHSSSSPALTGTALRGGSPPISRRLVALVQGAELFVFPSLYEGFGLPVLEAMMAGVPVVTTPCGSIPEVAGDFAAYAEPGSADDLAEQMQRVLAWGEEDRSKWTARAAEHARTFTWDKTADRLAEVFRSVAGQKD